MSEHITLMSMILWTPLAALRRLLNTLIPRYDPPSATLKALIKERDERLAAEQRNYPYIQVQRTDNALDVKRIHGPRWKE